MTLGALLALLTLVCLAAAPDRAHAGPRPAAEIRSLAWLRSQIVPNRLVPTPHPRRRSLILSYASGPDGDGPLHRKSFVYEVGLAAVALGMAGDWEHASRLLNALVRVQRADGSFWFSYNVHNGWLGEADHDMAIVRTGATAWAGYALTFYLERRPAAPGAGARREAARFLAAARRVADFLLTLRVTEASSSRGLLRGGRATVELAMAPGGGGVREVYRDRPMRWVSTEHNISAYFLFTAAHRLTREARYAAAAQQIRARLLGMVWQDDLGQFARGVLEDGTADRTRALDCASWGALFLAAVGERGTAARAVTMADRMFLNVHGEVVGHRPYHDGRIYANPAVQRFLLADAPDAEWKELPVVWSEGSLGVALARLRLGDESRARGILREVLKMREGGGIRYATREVPYELSTSPSVAGAAWHVILEESLRAQAALGFWSR